MYNLERIFSETICHLTIVGVQLEKHGGTKCNPLILKMN